MWWGGEGGGWGRDGQPESPDPADLRGRDLVGWAQYHTSWYAPHRDAWRRWYAPSASVRVRLAAAERVVDGYDSVGVHVRRGDYGYGIFPMTPVEWYLRTLRELWPTLRRPLLLVATDDRSVVAAFAEFDPRTAEDLGVELLAEPMPVYNYEPTERGDRWRHDFFADWWLLTRCAYVLGGNSTFSFSAAMTAARLRGYLRADLDVAKLVEVDPWDAYPLLHQPVERYHIDGIRR